MDIKVLCLSYLLGFLSVIKAQLLIPMNSGTSNTANLNQLALLRALLLSQSTAQSSVATQLVPCLTAAACNGCANDNTVILTRLGVQQRNIVRRIDNRFNGDDVCCGLCAPILGDAVVVGTTACSIACAAPTTITTGNNFGSFGALGALGGLGGLGGLSGLGGGLGFGGVGGLSALTGGISLGFGGTSGLSSLSALTSLGIGFDEVQPEEIIANDPQ